MTLAFACVSPLCACDKCRGQYVSSTSLRHARCCYEKRTMVTRQWRSRFLCVWLSSASHRSFCCHIRCLITLKESGSPECTRSQWMWPYTGDDAHRSASMEPLDGHVTHLPQWRGQRAAAAASRPSSYVRPSALRARKVFTAMERPPQTHPQCYSPPPHDPELPSLSTWHVDVRALRR